MQERQVTIRKVENGYVVKTVTMKQGKSKHIDGMLKLLQASGMYQSWQEHKEEDIRRALEKMAILTPPEKEEKEVICKTLDEVSAFMKNFFEIDLDRPISL
jgi:ribosomal protein S8